VNNQTGYVHQCSFIHFLFITKHKLTCLRPFSWQFKKNELS